MKKTWILLGILILMATSLYGCSSSADMAPSASPSASPTASALPSPSVTVFPSATETSQTQEGITTLEDSMRVSGEIEQELSKLSETSQTQALVAGTTAIVSVEYDTAYQAGMTERLTGMIEDRVQAVEASLENVRVTDDPALGKQITDLKEKLDANELTFSQLQSKVDEIVLAIGTGSTGVGTGTGTGVGTGTGTGMGTDGSTTGPTSGTGTGTGAGTGAGTGT